MNAIRRFSWFLVRTSVVWGIFVTMCNADPVKGGPVDESLFDQPRRQHPVPSVQQPAELHDGARPSGFAPTEFNRRSFWAEELGMAGVSEYSLPLLAVAQRMQEVQQMLARGQCGEPTQHAQNEILRSIDLLLEQAGQCSGSPCKSAASSSSGDKPCNRQPNGQKPGNKPGNSGKTGSTSQTPPAGGQPVDTTRVRTMMKRLWGELPARQREQMMQLPAEEFLPQYELLIEDYFRRLSDHNPDNHPSQSPNP